MISFTLNITLLKLKPQSYVFINKYIFSLILIASLFLLSPSNCSEILNRKRNELFNSDGINYVNTFNFFDDQLCLSNYDVSEGSIIRTKDSLAQGAKYLNVSELGSSGKAKDECLKLCCKTPHCNVVTFEEKKGGSCYMFDCGSIENFLCKFTDQAEFMSGILRKREEPLPIFTPPTSNLNRHEAELTQLRTSNDMDPAHQYINSNPNIKHETNSSSIIKDKSNGVGGGGDANKSEFQQIEHSNSKCSRYQFECKTSRMCIAIYNTCDGIAQCSDGSDEGPELQCPGGAQPNIPKSVEQLIKNNVEPNVPSLNSKTSANSNNALLMGDRGQNIPKLFPNDFTKSAQQLDSSSNNGNYNKYNSNAQQHQQQQFGNNNNGFSLDGNNIFAHRIGSIIDAENNYGNPLQQQPRPQNNLGGYYKSYDYNLGGPEINPYSQQGSPMYNNPNVNNGNIPMKYPNYGNTRTQMHPQFDKNIPIENMPQNYNPNVPPRQYFTSSPNNNVQSQPINQQINSNSQQMSSSQNTSQLHTINSNTLSEQGSNKALNNLQKLENYTSSKIASTTTTPKSTELKDGKLSSAKGVENQIINSLLSKASLNISPESAAYGDNEGEGERPGVGAVLAFIIGVAMSIIMVFILSCRLRKLKTVSRRRGKNRLDPDYLVDGMYL